jgi:hypothetical protein
MTNTNLSGLPDDIKEILEKIRAIINSLPNLESSDTKIDIPTLQKAEENLNDLLPMLQSVKIQAKREENWDLLQIVRPAIRDCADALDAVRAAIIRGFVIGLHQQDMQAMKDIRERINRAAKAQQVFDGLVGLAKILIRVLA